MQQFLTVCSLPEGKNIAPDTCLLFMCDQPFIFEVSRKKKSLLKKIPSRKKICHVFPHYRDKRLENGDYLWRPIMWIIGLTYAALWSRVIDSVCVTVIELSTEKSSLSCPFNSSKEWGGLSVNIPKEWDTLKNLVSKNISFFCVNGTHATVTKYFSWSRFSDQWEEFFCSSKN